jgi:hypothetical protein
VFPPAKIFHPRRASSPRLGNISRYVIQDANRELGNLDSSVDSELEVRNMADLDGIFKALRLVPEFDGNQNVLTRFIKLCDQLVAEYAREGDNLANYALLNGILNKVTGPAARLINTNGIPEDWLGIRNALINNFADQRDETSLYNDLALLTQGMKTPQEFYEQCQNLFSTIMTYVTLHEAIPSTIESKRDLYKKLTLQAFVRGLKDPLGYRIRCMRPDTIEKALEFVHEESNTLYLQNRNDKFMTDKRQTQFQPPRYPNNFMPQRPPMHLRQPDPMVNAPGPSGQNLPNVPHQRFPPARFNQIPQGPSRTQQMFGALPRSNMSTGFRIPPRPQRNDYSRPMSGISHPDARSLPRNNNRMDINVNDFKYDYDSDYQNDSYNDYQYDYDNNYDRMYYYQDDCDSYNLPEGSFSPINHLPIENLPNSETNTENQVNSNFSQALKKNPQR